MYETFVFSIQIIKLNIEEFPEMSIWKEIREKIYKFGDTALDKAEILTKMGKYKFAIKNKEGEIDTMRMEIGDYSISQIEKNESINEEIIRLKIEKMNEIRKQVEELQNEYNEIKAKLVRENKTDAGEATDNEKQAG